MRKIPYIYDNPLDNFLIQLSEDVCPYAYSMGFTPNMITTLSNITCILTIILLLNANYYWAALAIMIMYYFDCLDGHFARKYDMVTVFGDYYDHLSDLLKIIAILLVLYYINPDKFYKIIPVIVFMGIMMAIHMGCQELLYENNESNTLEPAKCLCPVKNQNDTNIIKKTLESTKLFGCGTFYITIALSIIYYAF